MKTRFLSILAILSLSVAAGAQQHSAFDTALALHRNGIEAAAPIFGYNLKAGNWTIHQLPCPAMTRTTLLRYVRRFPDGSESIFTAVVPVQSGPVQIVPVLYAGRTPFTPAPKDPRNVALFNRLVPTSIIRRDLSSQDKWIDLGSCYAYMTGSNALAGPDHVIGIAGAPAPFLHYDPHSRAATLTFADRDSYGAYRLWSLRFNHRGRLTAASTQNYAVPTAGKWELVPSRTAPSATPPGARLPEQAVQHAAIHPASPKARQPQTREQFQEQGWKFIPNPPQPPEKFTPNAPQPPAKVTPNPPSQ